MRERPLVSIVIPVYNAGTYLRAAIDSILYQSYKNIEIIVVDDGSTDGCMESVRELIQNESRIKTLTQKNSGKSVAMNCALEAMEGEYWAIQDADDLSHPHRIEKQLGRLLEKKELAAVFVGHDLMVNEKQFAPTLRYKDVTECCSGIQNFAMPAHDATGLYRASLVKEMRFDPDFRIGQGLDYVLRVGEEFPVEVLGECLYTYRINYDSTIRKDPRRNNEHISKVLDKACKRRGISFQSWKKSCNFMYKKQSRSRNNHIVSHGMESVVDLKRHGRKWEALKVGILCCKLNLLDGYCYKPMVYSVLPFSVISKYRSSKKQRRDIKKRLV